jgi:Protein of unknown function (DUF3168)
MISGVIALAVADATVQNLVGTAGTNPPAIKVYPLFAEQAENRPYVTVRRTSAVGNIAKNVKSDCDTTTFDVCAYADTYKKAFDILKAIRAVIENYTGTSAGVDIKKIWYVGSGEDLYYAEDKTCILRDTYSARHTP